MTNCAASEAFGLSRVDKMCHGDKTSKQNIKLDTFCCSGDKTGHKFDKTCHKVHNFRLSKNKNKKKLTDGIQFMLQANTFFRQVRLYCPVKLSYSLCKSAANSSTLLFYRVVEGLVLALSPNKFLT